VGANSLALPRGQRREDRKCTKTEIEGLSPGIEFRRLRQRDQLELTDRSDLFTTSYCGKNGRVQNSFKSSVGVTEAASDEVPAMFRSISTVLLGTALLTASVGCRTSCGNGHGWFTSHSRGEPPCQLTSNGKLMEGCFDPITGRPIPCPPADSTILIPGGTSQPGIAPRPDELPYPSPGDMIPRPGVPYAPPAPAPGMEGAATTPKNGTVLKGTTAKQ